MADRIVRQPSTQAAQARFTDLPAADVERSTFDRSSSYKGTFDAGKLIPFFVDEVLPGDTFSTNATLFMRLATPLKPIMDNVQVDIHWFFVPNRLLWEDWQLFMGERKKTTDDPSSVTVPEAAIELSSIEGTVADHMGLPLTDNIRNIRVMDLPFRAYEKVFNDWYRNQNFTDELDVFTGDAVQDRTNMQLLDRHKRRDYFTSALPFPQKGDPVFLPLGQTAPVVSDEETGGDGLPRWKNSGDQEVLGPLRQLSGAGNNAEFSQNAGDGSAAAWQRTALFADLTSATASTVNEIRTAFQIQKLLERDARGGTRYIEVVLNHFNVQSPDFRMMRAEFLGGGTGVVNINPVASTVETPDTPQANLSATGTGVIKGGFTHSFVEHGFLVGICSARADLTYQNGIEKMWLRETRYDYYWPSLSHLGEQAIENREIWVGADQDDETDRMTWGYQERYAEYRFRPGRITGRFRSNSAAPLDVWHLAQDFDQLPALNDDFLRENPPIDRVIAVPSEPHFICDGWIKHHCTRPMPIYSVPGLIDHF